MNLLDNYEDIQAEQIAEVALMRTNMVIIGRALEPHTDFMALQKNKPSIYFLVEVKATELPEKDLYQTHSNVFDRVTQASKTNPYILFFINTKEQTGYFEIIQNGIREGINKLRVDLLTNKIRDYFNSLHQGLEFPPYSFNNIKRITKPIPIPDEYKVLRLFNLMVTPYENRNEFTLKIKIADRDAIPFPFRKCFYNPNLKEFLFFVKDGKEYTDMVLPDGLKYITYEIDSPKNEDFEIKLACEYLVNRNQTTRFS